MDVFDLNSMDVCPYEERDKNVFFKTGGFKTRIIKLLPGEEILECQMDSYVIFIVLEGKAEVTVNKKKTTLIKNQCLITEPATISMQSGSGARIIGIQIVKD